MVDISKYSKDRIGKSYVMMNCFKWDPFIFGRPPKNWAKMTNKERHLTPRFNECMRILVSNLTEEERHFYWNKYELSKPKYNDKYLKMGDAK